MDSSLEVQSQNFALITLKERCHFLKQQLKAADEENIKLKVQIANSKMPNDSSTSSQRTLIEDVVVLKKEKEQLSNQMHILVTENSNMWSRLSKLTDVNRNLTRRFAKISETLEKHGINNSMSESDMESSVTLDCKDYKRNLEEMSLLLINGIKLEKTELESQYAQMVDLHVNKETVTRPDLAFSSVEGEEETVMAGVRKHAQRLHQMKQTLIQQQVLLVAALEDLKKLRSAENNAAVRSAEVTTRDVATEPIAAETVRAVPITPTVEAIPSQPGEAVIHQEQLCPMCGDHIAGTSEQFFDHVATHFDEENENLMSSFVQLP